MRIPFQKQFSKFKFNILDAYLSNVALYQLYCKSRINLLVTVEDSFRSVHSGTRTDRAWNEGWEDVWLRHPSPGLARMMIYQLRPVLLKRHFHTNEERCGTRKSTHA